MRTQTKTMQFIEAQCPNLGLEQKALFARTKTVLNLYHRVVWSVKGRADNMKQEIVGTYGMKLSTALMYLSEFAPVSARASFESKVTQMFEAKWLIDLADMALQYVKVYPGNGELLAQLLQKRFMEEVPRTDAIVSEALSVERSTYYDRKKEAIFLFGISLFGFVLPTTLITYQRVSLMGMKEDTFFELVSENLNKQIGA